MDIVIENLKDYRKPILLKSIFKEDTKVLYDECRWVMQDWLSPHISSSTNQTAFYFAHSNSITHDNDEFSKKLLTKISKGNISKNNWKMVRNSHFKKIFTIAQKHNVTMRWCGNDPVALGDQWIISMAGKEIGVLRV